MALISELRRRRVFRTFALFIVGAWVLIQVAQAAFEAWGIPMQLLRYLWIGLALASPVALLFAWRYDITTDGIVRTPPSAESGNVDLSLKRSDYLIIGAFILVLSMVGWEMFRQAETDEPLWREIRDSGRPAIAVLPFADLTPTADMAFFGTGVAEALLGELGHITELDVIARTSSFQLQERGASLAEIATALAVDYLVEGSINREADVVYVVATLIEAETGRQLWSKTFEGEADRSFTAQQDIAGAVAGFLELSIGDPRAHGGTTSFDAYEAYLRAWNEDDLDLADLFLDEALAHDPDFALAVIGKAWVQWELQWGGRVSPEDAWRTAEPFLRRALEISDELGTAHALLGGFQVWRNQPEEAEAALRRALEINPSDTFALGRMSQLLNFTGRSDEGIAMAERLVRLDPLNAGRHHMLGNRRLTAGDVEGARDSFERALELRPDVEDFWFQYAFRMSFELGPEFFFDTVARYQTGMLAPGEPVTSHPRFVRFLGMKFGEIGDHERARDLLGQVVDLTDSIWAKLDLAAIALTERDYASAWTLAWEAIEGMPANDLFVRIAAHAAIRLGKGQERVLEHFRTHWPALFDDPPGLEGIEPESALMAALLVRNQGEDSRADAITAAVLAAEGPDSVLRGTLMAASGDVDGALDALRSAGAAGAIITPRFLLGDLMEDVPGFQELIRPWQEEQARVRAKVNAMLESGAIVLPDAVAS